MFRSVHKPFEIKIGFRVVAKIKVIIAKYTPFKNSPPDTIFELHPT